MSRKSRFPAFGAVLLFLVFWASACNQKSASLSDDPKKVLTAYISKSFSVKSANDKQEMEGYLTRDARARLSAWSEEQFRQAFMDNKREFVKLVFSESKAINPAQTDITYELTYIDKGDGSGGASGNAAPSQKETKVTQKKMAELVNDGGKWLIANVQNIKELVEYRHEMTLP